ncbi:MAG: hypothetical protein RJA98_2619, partial [Pseudomonadota bacterium]
MIHSPFFASRRYTLAAAFCAAWALAPLTAHAQASAPVRVASKIDTEGSLLGQLVLQVLESHGVKTVNRLQLGNTKVVRGA